jgi:hypothetical protein
MSVKKKSDGEAKKKQRDGSMEKVTLMEPGAEIEINHRLQITKFPMSHLTFMTPSKSHMSAAIPK